jgi:hypothetical protein
MEGLWISIVAAAVLPLLMPVSLHVCLPSFIVAFTYQNTFPKIILDI